MKDLVDQFKENERKIVGRKQGRLEGYREECAICEREFTVTRKNYEEDAFTDECGVCRENRLNPKEEDNE